MTNKRRRPEETPQQRIESASWELNAAGRRLDLFMLSINGAMTAEQQNEEKRLLRDIRQLRRRHELAQKRGAP